MTRYCEVSCHEGGCSSIGCCAAVSIEGKLIILFAEKMTVKYLLIDSDEPNYYDGTVHPAVSVKELCVDAVHATDDVLALKASVLLSICYLYIARRTHNNCSILVIQLNIVKGSHDISTQHLQDFDLAYNPITLSLSRSLSNYFLFVTGDDYELHVYSIEKGKLMRGHERGDVLSLSRV
jgi:hypothetical protein